MQLISPELLELEAQLSKPSGGKGIEIADMMNATNIGMTRATIMQLDIQTGNSLLELGHGNAGHLSFLLDQAPMLHYTGLEISQLMQAEAERMNAAFCSFGNARFVLYDGGHIPFEDGRFDRMFAVNCLYFWPLPAALLNEVHRVLRPDGLAAITYAHRSFMQKLPFVQSRFRLYDDAAFSEEVAKTDFNIVRLHQELEQVRSKAGDLVERPFTVAILRKA
jgi:SAM-dependent methyltransferase